MRYALYKPGGGRQAAAAAFDGVGCVKVVEVVRF